MTDRPDYDDPEERRDDAEHLAYLDEMRWLRQQEGTAR